MTNKYKFALNLKCYFAKLIAVIDMKKIIPTLASLVLSIFGATGCSSDKVDHKHVISGFGVDLEFSPCLSTAIKAEVKQEGKANLTVYAGYCNGFVDTWNSFEIKPDYERIVLKRCIRNQAGNDILNVYFDLPDFFDESKYLVTIRDDGNGWLTKEFTFKFKDSISLNEITIDKGYIFYTIRLLDKDNQIIDDFGLFNAVDTGGLYFEKIDKQLNFSLYEIR